MSTTQSAKIAIENINHPGKAYEVDAKMSKAMKRAYMKVLPKTRPGLTIMETEKLLVTHLPESLFPGGAKAAWYAKAVQLDLEAKHLVVRENTSPLRLFKASQHGFIDALSSAESKSHPKHLY
jgi:hypothetical protein